jgi:hypothetical protein
MTPRSTTVDLADALPRRLVAVRPPQTVGPLAALGVFALLFGLLGWVLWWLGPDLVTDWRMRSDAVPAREVRIEEARCQSRLFVTQFCSVSLADDRSVADGKRTLRYGFIDAPRAQPAASVALHSRSDPSLVSTDLGLDKLYSRTLTLAIVAALLALCAGVPVRMVQQGLRTSRAFRNLGGQRLIPVIVEVERNNFVPPRGRLWVYLYDDGGRRERAFVELPSRERPLFTDVSEKRALALRGEQGGTPLLLDARLNCLDLTQPEKAAFYAACRAVLGGKDDKTSV